MPNEIIAGILRLSDKGVGVLCDPERSLRPFAPRVAVPAPLVRKYSLVSGAALAGPVRRNGPVRELTGVETVCGLAPEAFRDRTPYAKLVAVDPSERFDLGVTGDLSMRIVDLIAPIGKGTRGLIVSPPKAGKTMILERIAQSIRAGSPETRVIVLLIDERPEEVTQFRRAVDAEVFASSMDQSMAEHIELAELTLAHVRTELECGRDVVVLVDSLTRMGRAFNSGGASGLSDAPRESYSRGGGRGGRDSARRGRNTGRIMSGGLQAGALEIPRRFFGLARNIENGGSVTIVATALVDTNSRMDEVIFQEFKGTGNSEIVLDRSLADARVFPAINLNETGTRKEEILHGPDVYPKIALLRRALADLPGREVIPALAKQIAKHRTNREFLESLPG
ncbi:transcription termination factor Rho [Candidatus Sumerlaeota bacterium]|nr:transcription termination factor Rho [Candidatus Sumerlaeota bacterium]